MGFSRFTYHVLLCINHPAGKAVEEVMEAGQMLSRKVVSGYGVGQDRLKTVEPDLPGHFINGKGQA